MKGAMQAAAMGFTQGLAGGRVQTVPHEKGQVECELDILETGTGGFGRRHQGPEKRREINTVPSAELACPDSVDGTMLISRRAGVRR